MNKLCATVSAVMKKRRPSRLVAFCVAVAMTSAMLEKAIAQNTLISGDLSVGTNWDLGAPTTIGNIGIIDSSNTGANQGIMSGTSLTGLFIEQTGGTVAGSGISHTLDNTQYEISSGLMGVNGLTLQNASLLTISGGTVQLGSLPSNLRSLALNNGTITITDGSLNITNDLTFSNSGTPSTKVVNFHGGTTTVTDAMFNSFQTNGTANFSGDAILNVGTQLGANQSGSGRFLNIGLGNGAITTLTLETRLMEIDWATGSGFSFTATNIVDSGAASTWQDLWNAGRLTVDGGQVGTFADNFQVDVNNTITIVPEPASLTAVGLLGLLGLGHLRRYRNRRSDALSRS